MSEPIKFNATTATQLSERMTSYSNDVQQHMGTTVNSFLDFQGEWNDAKSNLFVEQLNAVITDANNAIAIFQAYSDKLMAKINKLRS